MASRRPSKSLEEVIELALGKITEDVDWDISLTVSPDEQGNPQPSFLLVMSIAGSIVGSKIQNVMTLPFAHYTPEVLELEILGIVRAMREQRSQTLQGQKPLGSLIGGGAQ